jgi:tyrosinase
MSGLKHHAEHGAHEQSFSRLTLLPEVIGPELEALSRSAERESVVPAPPVARVRLAAVTAIERKDQKDLGDVGAAFLSAVKRLVEDGTYRTLALIHADMSHNMHGTMIPLGVWRFLAWHRRYLQVFEQALQEADRVLRPGATTPISVPYWRWVDPFPAWLGDLSGFTHPSTGAALPSRKTAPPPPKPTASDVQLIMERFEDQLSGFAVNGYTRFTWGLEGWGVRRDGTSLPAHNHVHGWVGGIMDNTSFSPADPVFWLHHAEIDRLWSIWQTAHPGLHPPLTGAARVMDPWPETYDDVVSIASLGYRYQSESP